MLNIIKKIGKVALIGAGIVYVYQIGRYSGIYDAVKEFTETDDDRYLTVHVIGPIRIVGDRSDVTVDKVQAIIS